MTQQTEENRMPLLNENVQKQIRQLFADIENQVKLVLFIQDDEDPSSPECAMCGDTRQLVEELSGLSEKISLEVYDFGKDKAAVKLYQVDKIPAIAILSGPDYKDNRIRLYGIPSGYEFSTLIEDILMVSKGKADLTEQTLKEIGKLTQPVHIQVYTTPT